MSKLRTSRTRLVGAATTVVLAALSLTACGNGTGLHDEGVAAVTTPTAKSSSPAPSPSAAADVADSATPKTGPATRSSARSVKNSSAKAPAVKAPATAKAPVRSTSSNRPVTCEGSNTRTVAAPLTRPVNHMLLTVTNTGSKPCFLYYYPAVNFGQDVTHCSVVASQGSVPLFGTPGGNSGRNVGPAIVSLFAPGGDLAPGFPDRTTAEVETFIGTTPADSPFMIAAFC